MLSWRESTHRSSPPRVLNVFTHTFHNRRHKNIPIQIILIITMLMRLTIYIASLCGQVDPANLTVPQPGAPGPFTGERSTCRCTRGQAPFRFSP